MKLLVRIIIILSLGSFPFCNSDAQNAESLSSVDFFEKYFQELQNGKILLIDGRTAQMYAAEHIENSINIDADSENLLDLLQEYLEEDSLFIYCTTIRRTNKIVGVLSEIFPGKVYFIHDGLVGWKRNNLPIISAEE